MDAVVAPRGSKKVFDFIKKAYEAVDDPSTDSIISWAPCGNSFIVWDKSECAKLLGNLYLQRFSAYGFKETVSGAHLEYANKDFVRGQPERLEKIIELSHDPLMDPRERIFALMKNAYAMVDDPSTDSAISWGPEGNSFIVWSKTECYRKILPRFLGTKSFLNFEIYGFTKNVSGLQLEYANDDFVRGQPERLENIGKRYVALLLAEDDESKRIKHEERRKRRRKALEFDVRSVLAHIACERANRGQPLSKDLEDRVVLLKKEFDALLSSES